MSRRWTRFGVRSLLLLVTMACVYFGFKARSIQLQKEASAELRGLGGQLEMAQNESTGVTWLSGDTSQVNGVHFLGPSLGDEKIKAILRAASRLPELERMTFTETLITGSGERELKSNLPNLEIKVFTPVLAPYPIRRR